MKTKPLFVSVLYLLLMLDNQASAQTMQRLDTEVGHSFRVGPFTTLVRKAIEGGKEASCPKLQPMIKATFQSMQNHMASRAFSLGYKASWKILEVDQKTLDLFCNKRVMVLLRNQHGDELLLVKPPFVRMSDPKTGDRGTLIRINAAIIPKGSKVKKQPDEYGQVFMPDRLLK
ncbi:MAG: hypothetical protein WC217_00125 [Candidatus Paceibacterota bacterium]